MPPTLCGKGGGNAARHWISCRHCLASEVVTGILPQGTTYYTINSIVCQQQGAGKKPLTERLIFASLETKRGAILKAHSFLTDSAHERRVRKRTCAVQCCIVLVVLDPTRPWQRTSVAPELIVLLQLLQPIVNSIPSYVERSIEPLHRPVTQFQEIFD